MSAFTRTDVPTDIGYYDDSNKRSHTYIYYLHARRPTHKHIFTHNQCADVYNSKLCMYNINA